MIVRPTSGGSRRYGEEGSSVGRYASWSLIAFVGVLAGVWAGGRVFSQDDVKQTQGLLGPGLYVFQTRTRGSSCGDSERDGYVMSFVAAIDGVPASTTMTMQLINNQHFVKWQLRVSDDGKLSAMSRMGTAAGAPDSSFTATLEDDRWKGAGARTYNGTLDGKPTRCRVDYDALLRRIDVR
jgi:hypothetical protein